MKNVMIKLMDRVTDAVLHVKLNPIMNVLTSCLQCQSVSLNAEMGNELRKKNVTMETNLMKMDANHQEMIVLLRNFMNVMEEMKLMLMFVNLNPLLK